MGARTGEIEDVGTAGIGEPTARVADRVGFLGYRAGGSSHPRR
ncbi:hypothetical protein [Salinispora tropica]|nr:hypothetical protein [Salinispora tropica]